MYIYPQTTINYDIQCWEKKIETPKILCCFLFQFVRSLICIFLKRCLIFELSWSSWNILAVVSLMKDLVEWSARDVSSFASFAPPNALGQLRTPKQRRIRS